MTIKETSERELMPFSDVTITFTRHVWHRFRAGLLQQSGRYKNGWIRGITENNVPTCQRVFTSFCTSDIYDLYTNGCGFKLATYMFDYLIYVGSYHNLNTKQFYQNVKSLFLWHVSNCIPASEWLCFDFIYCYKSPYYLTGDKKKSHCLCV